MSEEEVDWGMPRVHFPRMNLKPRRSSEPMGLPAGRAQVNSDENILQSPSRPDRVFSIAEDDPRAPTEKPPGSVNACFFQKAIDPEQVDNVCLVAMTTVANLRETASNLRQEALREYVSKVFELPAARFEELSAEALTSDQPDLKLEVNVLRAADLPPKDANGKSDPYCRLGILPRSAMDTHTVKRDDLLDWKKDGLVQEVFQTDYKEATLCPQWNEEIVLTVKDTKNELLVVEVWDSDENKVGLSRVKGIMGLGTFITDRGGDDFMCRAFYPLSSIPMEGETQLLPLFSHSKKHERGSIKLELVVRGTRSDIPHEEALREHSALLRAFVNHDSQTTEEGREGEGEGKRKYTRWWEGGMSKEAESLLLQHATLNDISLLQQASLRLSAFLQYHECYALKMTKFSELLAEIQRSEGEVDGSCYTLQGRPQWFIQLLRDVQALATNIREVLKAHLSLFNIKSEEELARIKEHVLVFQDLYRFEPFAATLEPEMKHVKTVLEDCIKVAVPGWFLEQSAMIMPTDPEMHIMAFQGLCEHCLHQCQRAHDTLHPIFQLVGVDYFTHFFATLDTLLSSEAVSRLEKYRDEANPRTFEMYLVFRDIGRMVQYVDTRRRDSLSLPKSYEWFKEMVNDWIKLATTRCKERIRKAIEIDEEVTDTAKFSTSALDTKEILLQMGTFWKKLDWPLPLEAYPLITMIVKTICDSALFYVKEVYSSLRKEDLYDQNGQFHASEKLCKVLNNIHHIRRALSEMPERLDLERCYRWLEEAKESTGTSLRELISTVLASADDDIDNKMEEVVGGITKRLSPDIDQYLRDLTAAQGVSNEDAVTPLLDYLTRNLKALGDFLLPPVLANILGHLWFVVVEVGRKVQQLIPASSSSSSSSKAAYQAQAYQQLRYALLTLRDFFYADGMGLATNQLETGPYKSLLSDLATISLPTRELVFKFYSSVASQQQVVAESGEKVLGSLMLSVCYRRDKTAVEVNLIQGSGLPGLDHTGLSDPFVELTLLPKWHFPASAERHHKSSVQKQTVDPFFNEDFLLRAEEKELKKDGAILLLTIFDHDRISANDFAGMCVISCKDLPILAGTSSLISDPSEPERVNLSLPLFHVSPDTPALVELATRKQAGDSAASDFWKHNRKLFDISINSRHLRRSSSTKEQLGLA